ncbi:MAG TPA: RNA polymerase sigma factor [Thermoanaerobaculia bacterium]|nr:RNA polymerase sigma factor [Thermoanaerobaculia bacterium]
MFQLQAAEMPPPTPQDAEVLTALFREHSGRIFRIAYRLTGNPSDAEDVLQTIFLRLLRRDEVPDLRASAASYLHRAAVNAGLDLLRARKRTIQVPLQSDNEEEPDLPLEADPRTGPESYLERGEQRRRLRDAIASLSPRAAEVFALRYVEGYGNTEIAEMLETTRSSIGVTLHRSRERLKEVLSEGGEGSTPADSELRSH